MADSPQRSAYAIARDGLAFWQRHLRSLTTRAQIALEEGDQAGALALMQRARVAERAVKQWEKRQPLDLRADQEDQ